MNLPFLYGALLGAVAALMLNIGKGVQKQKVHVFLQRRKMLAHPHRGDLGIWLVGLLLTTGAAVPFSLGLKFSQSPSTVSAMTGIGLIGLTVYAVTVIGEKITARDGVGIALVIVGTSLIAYLGAGKEFQTRSFDDGNLIRSILPLLVLAAISCVSARKIRRLHGVAFGITAGFCLGLTLFLADAALVRSEGSIWGQFSNPYSYAAMATAVVTTIVTQIGFLGGRALEVVPSLNSSAILTPLFLEVSIYRIYPSVFCMAVVGVVIAGVILISIGAASRVVADAA